MSRQISFFFEKIISKFQSAFWKGFSTQLLCLLIMLHKWKKVVDNHQALGPLLTDLSNAFDYLNHDLLIAKLHLYMHLFLQKGSLQIT